MAIVVGSLASLTGCASVSDLRSQAPDVEGLTDKPIDVFASCVATKWSIDGSQISSLPNPQGATITMLGGSGFGYDAIMDVTRQGKGSHFAVYRRSVILNFAPFRKDVSDCR